MKIKIKLFRKIAAIVACACVITPLNALSVFADRPIFDIIIPEASENASYVRVNGIVYNFLKAPGNVSIGEVSVGNNNDIDVSEVVIPNSITVKGKSYAVTKIESEAFSLNHNIKSISFGKSIETIDASAFLGCSALERINVDNNSQYFKSRDGVLYSASLRVLVKYPEGKQDEKYLINSDTTDLGDYSFYGNRFLKELLFPDGLYKIGKYAFVDCQSIENINMGTDVREIGDYAFYKSGVKNVNLSPALTTIGKAAFAFSDIIKVSIPSRVVEIKESTFYNCESLSEIEFGSNVKKIGDFAFSNTNVSNVNFSGQITTVGKYAFADCSNLSRVNLSPILSTIGDKAFFNCSSIKTIDLPKYLSELGKDVFTGCTSLETFTARAGDPKCCSIENGILYNASVTKLIHYPSANTSLVYTLPSSLAEIEDNALADCKYINEFNIDATENHFEVEDGILYDYHKTTLIKYPLGKGGDNFVVPETVKKIANKAFKNSDISGIVNLPYDLDTIGDFAFEGCSNISAFNVDGVYIESENGVLYTKDKSELIQFPGKGDITSFEMPDTVKKIRTGAFSTINMESIKLNEGLEIIEDYAFSNTNIQEIEFPSTLTQIGDYAFSNTELSSVTFPENIKTIGESAFENCGQLKSIKFTSKSAPEELHNNAFLDCLEISSVVLPESADFNDYMETLIALNIDDIENFIVLK